MTTNGTPVWSFHERLDSTFDGKAAGSVELNATIEIPVDPDWNARVFEPRMGYAADGKDGLIYFSVKPITAIADPAVGSVQTPAAAWPLDCSMECGNQ